VAAGETRGWEGDGREGVDGASADAAGAGAVGFSAPPLQAESARLAASRALREMETARPFGIGGALQSPGVTVGDTSPAMARESANYFGTQL
jgi:hypothetical protein